jgi:mycothiol synthase
MTTRSYDRGDAAAVAELSNLVEQHAGGHPGATTAGVESYVSSLVRDVDLDARLVWAPGGVLVGMAFVPSPPAGGHVVHLFGGVHPRWRGQGLGRRLLDWQLTRARQIRAATAPCATWRAHAGIMVDDEPAARLFRRFGMEPARYWFDMVAPAADLEEPLAALPDGLRVAPYHPDHEAPLHAAHTEAFADHWGFQRRSLPEWAAISVRSTEFRADCSLLAFADDKIAGYVLCYADADPERLYVGQVGVRPPWRRRGLASAMLARVLRAAATAGNSTAGLAVDAAHPYGAIGVYERAGFSVTGRAVTYTTLLAPALTV